jgi:hypothetical protein
MLQYGTPSSKAGDMFLEKDMFRESAMDEINVVWD